MIFSKWDWENCKKKLSVHRRSMNLKYEMSKLRESVGQLIWSAIRTVWARRHDRPKGRRCVWPAWQAIYYLTGHGFKWKPTPTVRVLVPFPKFRYFFAALSARICGRERGGDTVQSARELFNMKKTTWSRKRRKGISPAFSIAGNEREKKKRCGICWLRRMMRDPITRCQPQTLERYC